MTFAIGTWVGPDEILSPLGAGGMGEVYRGRDTRLNREVAIKVLPESFSNDADRFTRFQQEGRATSALNQKESKLLVRADTSALYAPPGYLLFVREETLYAQPFDADRLQVAG